MNSNFNFAEQNNFIQNNYIGNYLNQNIINQNNINQNNINQNNINQNNIYQNNFIGSNQDNIYLNNFIGNNLSINDLNQIFLNQYYIYNNNLPSLSQNNLNQNDKNQNTFIGNNLNQNLNQNYINENILLNNNYLLNPFLLNNLGNDLNNINLNENNILVNNLNQNNNNNYYNINNPYGNNSFDNNNNIISGNNLKDKDVLNEQNKNENNIIEKKIKEVIEYKKFYLYKDRKAYLTTIVKKKFCVMIKIINYEENFEEEDFSAFEGLTLKTIDEGYNFFIDRFEKEKVKIEEIVEKQSIELAIKTTLNNSKDIEKELGILLYYNKEDKIISKPELFKKYHNLKIIILDFRDDIKLMKNEYSKLKKMRKKLNNLIKEKKIKENKDMKTINNMIINSYAEDELDNTFEIVNSINKIIYLIYATENLSIISYNLISHKKMIEIKNAHKTAITNFRGYLDKIYLRDLILSISGHDNNVKVWNLENWECLISIEKVNKNGDLDSSCILREKRFLYIVTCNDNDKEEDDEDDGSEPIKLFDFNGNKIKEIDYSNEKTFFICTYYDKFTETTYILTGNEGKVKSYDYTNNKLYHSYCSEEKNEVHCSLIVSEFDTGVNIIESSWDMHIRIWGFHDGILYAKIRINKNIKKRLHGICLWKKHSLFVGCGKSINLINLENGKTKRIIEKYHEKDTLTLKSINHPIYGECLISQGMEDSNIKLLFFEKEK